MGTYWHRLKPRLKENYPKRLIFFDTETKYYRIEDRIIHEFWFGYMIYRDDERREEKLILRREDFWDYIRSAFVRDDRTIYIFAHNCFFDFMIIGGFEYAFKYGWEIVKPPIVDKGLFYLELRHQKSKIVFVNLGNWFKARLADLGRIVGIGKYVMPNEDDTFDTWVSYCKRDTEIVERVYDAYVNFLRSHGFVEMRYTLAGQALSIFVNHFMNTDICVHADERVIQLERKAYHGGRNEAFKLGYIEGPVYLYDVKSMYPSVMRDNEYPVRLVKYIENANLYTYYRLRRNGYLVIADVEVETYLPIVPYKDKRLMAPIGRFRTVLTSVEMDYLLENGGKIHKIYALAYYQCKKIFDDYVNFFYERKLKAEQEKDVTNFMFYKILLNSLYGKFGQKSPRWKYVGNIDDVNYVDYRITIEPETGKRRSMRTYAGVVEMSTSEGESKDSFVAIAAFVTAYAWVKLCKYIQTAGWENVYYCDTDSVFVNEEGRRQLEASGCVGDALGMLELKSVVPAMKIYGLKDYELYYDNRVEIKLKGVGKDAVGLLAGDSIIAIEGRDKDEFIKRCIQHGIQIVMDNGMYVIDSGYIAVKENEFGVVSLQKLLEGLDVRVEYKPISMFLQTQWLSFASHIREGIINRYINRLLIKKLQRVYQKGQVLPDGAVKPFAFID